MPGKRRKVISENNDRMTSAECTELTLSELVRLAEDGIMAMHTEALFIKSSTRIKRVRKITLKDKNVF